MDKVSRKDKKILVAKMYTGEYIEKNIGHEIINFFKPDNGDYFYGYIIYNGKVNYCDEIDTILLVSDIKNRKVEILAKIDNPEFVSNIEDTHKKQVNYIQKHNIRYGGVLLNDIMRENGLDEYGIYITYKTKNIKKPIEKKFILLNDSNEEENENQFKLSWNIGHNLGYISNSNDEIKQFEKLNNKISEIKWNDIEHIKITNDIIKEYSYTDLKESFMDLINKKYDETVFSNMLYYYFCKKDMFRDFSKEVLKINLGNDIKIYKEKSTFSDSKIGRIDIFAVDNKNCIVIENKLKSAINGRYYSKDTETNKEIRRSQLYKYMKWVNDFKENKNDKEPTFKNYNKKYFIFVPNYKEIELKKDIEDNNLMPKDEENKDVYKIITYKEIFDYFNSDKVRNKMSEDKYYKDFVNALSYHIYTADKEMERKFVEAIKKGKK